MLQEKLVLQKEKHQLMKKLEKQKQVC